MKIGILQTGHLADALRADLGDYDALFKRLLGEEAFDYRVWNVVDMEFPDGPEDADGWLITGSRHGAYDDLPFIAPLEEFVRQVHASGRPLIGVCFGHQIVAQALGGKVVKFPEGWAVGPVTYDWNGEKVTLNAWHQDQVVEVPAGAKVLATHPFCRNAAMLFGDRIFTVQAHPEFGDATMAGLIEHRSAAVEPDRVAAARESLGTPVDNERLARMMTRFFTERRLA